MWKRNYDLLGVCLGSLNILCYLVPMLYCTLGCPECRRSRWDWPWFFWQFGGLVFHSIAYHSGLQGISDQPAMLIATDLLHGYGT